MRSGETQMREAQGDPTNAIQPLPFHVQLAALLERKSGEPDNFFGFVVVRRFGWIVEGTPQIEKNVESGQVIGTKPVVKINRSLFILSFLGTLIWSWEISVT